jgi:AraC family transcriptional regulator
MSATAISAGTYRRTGFQAGGFDVSDVAFAGGRRLPWHEHPRGCIAVVIAGDVHKRFARGAEDAVHGTLIRMPPAEPHEDVFGRDGARIVVVETDDGVGQVACVRDWAATLVAFRIARELADPDPFTPLALEGLALELMAAAARGPSLPRAAPWLERARGLLHERCREPLSVAELAVEVNVSPSHLARAFRAHYGDSVGGYARRARLEWAAGRVVHTNVPLVRLAAEAGFVDQSHFTRAFKREFGLTPARFRGAHH